MYIRNLTDGDILFNYNGKHYNFVSGDTIPIDENELPYNILEILYGNHRLSKIEDKYVEINKECIGSNFDDFLEEEGIKEEVEQKAKEKVEKFIKLANYATTDEEEYAQYSTEEENSEEDQSLNPEIIDNIIESEEKTLPRNRRGRRSNKG